MSHNYVCIIVIQLILIVQWLGAETLTVSSRPSSLVTIPMLKTSKERRSSSRSAPGVGSVGKVTPAPGSHRSSQLRSGENFNKEAIDH